MWYSTCSVTKVMFQTTYSSTWRPDMFINHHKVQRQITHPRT